MLHSLSCVNPFLHQHHWGCWRSERLQALIMIHQSFDFIFGVIFFGYAPRFECGGFKNNTYLSERGNCVQPFCCMARLNNVAPVEIKSAWLFWHLPQTLQNKNNNLHIQRYLIKAEHPCVVGFLVDAAAVCIDKISWGETIVWNAGSH